MLREWGGLGNDGEDNCGWRGIGVGKRVMVRGDLVL